MKSRFRKLGRSASAVMVTGLLLGMGACISLPNRLEEGSLIGDTAADDTAAENTAAENTAAGNAVENILRSHPGLKKVASKPQTYRLQIALGTVEKTEDGSLQLVQQGYRLGAEYFYPASSVKLFAAVAALERLHQLRRLTGRPLPVDTPLQFHPLFDGESLEDSDPTHLANGKITIRHEIRKLFLVSDNEAFNRLYEFVGQNHLADSLDRAGLGEARIVHRLSESRTAEQNRTFPRIDFGSGAPSGLTLPERTSPPLPPAQEIAGIHVGKGYMAGDGRVDHPLDFSEKNRFDLASLQRGLCMVTQPEVDCGGRGFRLEEADRALLVESLYLYPSQSSDPVYDATEYPDHWVKFLLPGLQRVIPKERLRIYNKIGRAYGFSTENAWVVDTQTGRSFYLAATLYTNQNGILNDDTYEYEPFADNFLADLGEAVARKLWEDRGPP